MELVAAADVSSKAEKIPPLRYTPQWNMENVRDNYCSKVYSDYIKMLDEIKPDIAFILTENCQKPEVVEECAKRGINVSIEKPIAVSFEEAKKIKESVDKYGRDIWGRTFFVTLFSRFLSKKLTINVRPLLSQNLG